MIALKSELADRLAERYPEWAVAEIRDVKVAARAALRDVLAEAARGSTISDIAATLFLSDGTVGNYLSEAITKLDAIPRVEAARIAEEKGWL